MVLVTQKAPNFISPAILENNEIIQDFNFKKYVDGKLVILFFWPMDFTFVCPSEIIAFNQAHSDLQKRNTKIVGVSIDSVFVHQAWKNTLPKNGGIGNVNFPMVSDIKRNIQKAYGIEHPTLEVALRASFLIDSNWIVRHQVVNDLPFGRKIKEIVRIIDAIDFHNKHGEVCPANWETGKKGMKPSLQGVKDYLAKNI